MSAEILTFTGVTRLDLPPERVLQAAIDAKVRDVVVLGYDEEGQIYLATSIGDNFAKINLMLDVAKARIVGWVDQ